MSTRTRLGLSAVLAVAAAAGTARATTFVAMRERTLARVADAIVLGTVTDVETVGGIDGAISTLVTVRVQTSYKGTLAGDVVLKQPGGELADRGLVIPGSPVFTPGERNLLFLSAARDGTARTTALGLGQYRLSGDDTMAERTVSEPVLGGARTRRLKLSRLLRTIARATTPTAGRPLVAVPAEATAPDVERAPAVGAFTLMDSPAARWHEADLGETVLYGVDPAGDPAIGPDASLAALDAAFAAWTNVDGATIALARGAAVAPAPLLCDGVSQIVFGDPFDEMPKPQACSGVLALGGYCTKGRGASESDVVNGQRFRRIAEGNITFNKGFASCPFWNATNLAEVATHEIGHTIGIGHSSESDDEPSPALKDATMYYRAHFDGRGAGLRADDVAAVRFLYPDAAGATTDDVDQDGVPDAQDDCPGNDPTLGLANPSQTDTDGDGEGDLCDACPLTPLADGQQSCGAIAASSLRVTDGGAQGSLVWRGVITLPDGADLATARVVLTAGDGLLVDTAQTPDALRRVGKLRARLLYRGDTAVVSLRRGHGGQYAVRATVRSAQLGTGDMPVVSASLALGTSSFAVSLSCPPRGHRHFSCRG